MLTLPIDIKSGVPLKEPRHLNSILELFRKLSFSTRPVSEFLKSDKNSRVVNKQLADKERIESALSSQNVMDWIKDLVEPFALLETQRKKP